MAHVFPVAMYHAVLKDVTVVNDEEYDLRLAQGYSEDRRVQTDIIYLKESIAEMKEALAAAELRLARFEEEALLRLKAGETTKPAAKPVTPPSEAPEPEPVARFPHVCKVCGPGKSFPTATGLAAHMRVAHKSGK